MPTDTDSSPTRSFHAVAKGGRSGGKHLHVTYRNWQTSGFFSYKNDRRITEALSSEELTYIYVHL